MELSRILYWIFGVIGVLVTIFLIIYLIMLHVNLSDLTEKYNDNHHQLEELQKHQASSSSRGPRGLSGERGPEGPIGKSGGEFLAQGLLRNLESNGSMVVDRLHGSGTASVAFLNKPSYQPNQIWSYLGNHQIRNQYGDCLEGDANTGDVYISGCDSNALKQKWKHNNYGQMSFPEGGICGRESLG